MLYTFEYVSQKERLDILELNKDKFLIEERNLTSGNFLIFADEPLLELPLSEPDRLDIIEGTTKELQTRTQDIELALADIMLGGI